MKVSVIIPAAGLGTRMSAAAAKRGQPAPSKQFAELGGIPIIIHTLRKFAAAPQVSEIVLALRKKEIEQFKPRLEKEGFKKPVRNGNALINYSVKAAPDDIVLVHDAVRPFVDVELIAAVIAAAAKHGAAIAGVPAVDTIKQVDRTAEGAVVTTTIPRERVVLAQTPQGFRYAVLRKAFDEATADGFTGTDEASVVERAGHEVAVVMGSYRNLKITTPADLQLAEFYLEQQTREKEPLAG